MRNFLLSLTVLAGVAGVATVADAAPVRVDTVFAPQVVPVQVLPVQYYHGGGPDWRRHEWRRREAFEHRRRHEWRRAHGYRGW